MARKKPRPQARKTRDRSRPRQSGPQLPKSWDEEEDWDIMWDDEDVEDRELQGRSQH